MSGYNRAVKKTVTVFVAILFLAVVLRTIGITFESLWLDEGYQSMVDAFGRAFPDFFHMPAKPFVFHFTNPGALDDVLRRAILG